MKSSLFTSLIAACAIILAATLAEAKTVYGMSASQVSKLKLNHAEQIYPLVNKYDSVTNTNLKMKVTTYDLGGSSDVSNLLDIYLSSFSMTEMKQAGALHKIASVTKVLSATRLAAGVYEIIAEEFPLGSDWPTPIEDFRLYKVRYLIEASQLSVDMRQLGSIDEFGEKQVQTAIQIQKTVLN